MTLPGSVDRRIGAADVLKEAATAYGRHAATVIGISLPLQVVGALVSLMVLAKTGPLGFPIIGVVTAVLAQIMIGASTLMLLGVRERGEVPPIAELLAAVFKRLPAMLGLALLTGILTTIASLFFIVPGIITTVAWAVATPALIATRCRITDAMGQSWELTKGHRWDVFVIVILQSATGIVAPRLAVRMSDLNLEDYVLGLALVNTFLVPLVALALSEMFLRLHAARLGPPEAAPQGPFVPGAPQPGAPHGAVPAAPYVPVTPMTPAAPIFTPAAPTHVAVTTHGSAPMFTPGQPAPAHPYAPAPPAAPSPPAGATPAQPTRQPLGATPAQPTHQPLGTMPAQPVHQPVASMPTPQAPPVTRTHSVGPPGMG